MSLQDPRLPRRTHHAAPVARLDSLPRLQAWCVTALRQWMGGAAGREALAADLTARHGADAAPALLNRLAGTLDLLARHGQRHFAHNPAGSDAVSPDEAFVAHFVATAATGEREEALMLAMLLVRADLAPALVARAQALGLGVLRVDSAAGRTCCGQKGTTGHLH